MKIKFIKYNAVGNDFIVIDNRENQVSALSKDFWRELCTPKIGIGADGVLLLEKSSKADFKMHYLNADGGEVSMCGNGARTLTAFYDIELNDHKPLYKFETQNGIYECLPIDSGEYRLKMTELYDVNKIDVRDLAPEKVGQYLNTGVPHCVFEVSNIDQVDVYELGKKVRYDQRFQNGSNANFYQVLSPGKLAIRTYERGVENETLSCGTGAVATAIVASKLHSFFDEITLQTKGGVLKVQFSKDYSEIYLCGKVEKIFEGLFEIH